MADVAPSGGAGGAPAGDGAMAGGKRSRWMAHVKKTMRANKGKSLSQVLKMAKKTYKKHGGGPDQMMGGGLSPMPLAGAGRRSRKGSRKASKGKKGSRKH